MMKRIARKIAIVMSTVGLSLAISQTPAHANSILTQGTTENYNWAIDDEGIVYIYPVGTTSDVLTSSTGDVTYKLYTYGSMQIVYVSTACSTESISNSASMFESATSISSTDTLYEGFYSDTAYAHLDAEVEEEASSLEDATATHAPGWAYEEGAYHYYEPDGSLRTNARVSVDGAWYYLDGEGTPLTSKWFEYDGAWYYFGADGKLMTNSWLHDDGAYYYLGADGAALVDYEFESDGTIYSFDSEGRCSKRAAKATSDLQDAVVSMCYATPSTGRGRCAAWVANVFKNAGIGSWNGNACDFYYAYCTSTDVSELKPGMIIAVSSCAGTSASLAYGHVGIYLGDGLVMHNLLGTVGTMTLDGWISYFSGYSTPAWGWLGGVALN